MAITKIILRGKPEDQDSIVNSIKTIPKGDSLIIDLSQISVIGDYALQVFIRLRDEIITNGGLIVIFNIPNPAIRDKFQRCGFEPLFKFASNEDAAIKIAKGE